MLKKNPKILKTKRILLCVCGSIASYKSLELIRILKEQCYSVKVAVSQSALEFITLLSLETISQEKVIYSRFQNSESGKIDHIAAAQEIDMIVVAPATANILAKFVYGIGDDLISTILLATNVPIFFAPAMNVKMWENPIIQNNIEKAKKFGAVVLNTTKGLLACNSYGMGKMLEAKEIANIIFEYWEKNIIYPSLQGKKVLISLGGTREYIDPFRFISNASSGKMGLALADIFKKQGIEIFLVCAHTEMSIPAVFQQKQVITTTEMANEMLQRASDYDIIIMCAAISDYKTNIQHRKIKEEKVNLELEKTLDILKELGKNKKEGQILVGFAAETDSLEFYATEKLKKKNLDIIFGNKIEQKRGFGTNKITYQIITNKKISALLTEDKKRAANQLVITISNLVKKQ